MSADSYKVEIVPPHEVEQLIRCLKFGPDNKRDRREAILSSGLMLKGEFELTARNHETGDVEWSHKAANLITDYGRREWIDDHFRTLSIFFAPSIEAPNSGRCSISCNNPSNQAFMSASLTPSNNPATNTKTLTTTFGTPTVTRTLGIIGVGNAVSVSANAGIRGLAAYALLTPPKTQTTTQTLEVIYKISMSPIY